MKKNFIIVNGIFISVNDLDDTYHLQQLLQLQQHVNQIHQDIQQENYLVFGKTFY